MRRLHKFLSNRKPLFWLLLGLITVILLIKCSGNKTKKDTKKPVPVVVAVVKTQDMPVYISALGAVTSSDTVTVQTQVNGPILKIFYREGQMVKAGDLLIQIDPRPYEALVKEYEGQLVRDQALLENARLDLKRYQILWSQNSVSKQTLDTQVALVKQYEGTVLLDQGLLDGAKVNLAYCRITAPIDGQVGLRLVDEGNVVQTTSTTGLVVLNTVNPITVIFTIPEDQIPQVQKQMKQGKTLTVQAYDRAQTQLLATGTVLSLDNQIDPSTGTVKVRALFQNDDNRLFPNQFVNIQLLVDTVHNANVVPTAAIQHGTQGPFVYLINRNHTVRVKPVTVGVSFNGLTTVSSGLLPRYIVVTEGADKLTNGSAITLPK